MKASIAAFLIAPLALLAGISSPRAEWRRNGNPVNARESWQGLPAIAADEKGHSLIVWSDVPKSDFDTGPHIYGQRLDLDGVPLWDADGVVVCAAPGSFKRYAAVAMDWDQGAVVAWEDSRGHRGSIYAQRIDSEGNVCWPAEGVPVCDAPYSQEQARVVPVSSGGAIVVWVDRRGGRGYYDIYAQRLDKDGACLWEHNGVCVFSGVNLFSTGVSAVSDGADGAVIAWNRRNWAPDAYDICAQHIDANGVCRWTENGMVVCNAPGEQLYPETILLDRGAVIIVWYDRRNESMDIYAQKVSAGGVTLWEPNGMCVCCGAWDMQFPYIVSSNASEAIIAWPDKRSGNLDIYAQKLNCDGKLLWAPEGVALCTEPARQSLAGLVKSADGGAVATWYDERFMNCSVFAQKISADGSVLWDVNGISVRSGAEIDEACYDICIAGDSERGAIIVWQDFRASIKDSIDKPNIYAMRVMDVSASVTRVDFTDSPFRLRQNYPNPFNPTTEITFELEEPSFISLGIYDASGRFLRRLAEGRRPAGAHVERWDGLDMSGRAVASGIYFCRLEAGSFTETKKMVLLR